MLPPDYGAWIHEADAVSISFHSDALAPFHWILHKQDEHKDRFGNNVTAAPDGGMWMYNAHSNVAPEGYCIVHAGAEYHGVKQELGDYFKHGVRKLRCVIPDISADDINDPEAYKRRTAPETETDDRRHGKDPMAGCARRGDCSAGKGSGKVVSSSTGSGEIGTWRVVVWASTLVTVRTVSTLVVTEVEGRSTVRHEEGTTTAEAPASASMGEAQTSFESAETASSTDDTGASVPSLDIIPFEVAYSMTFTQTTLVTVVETMVKKIHQSSSSFSTVTSCTNRAMSSNAVDTTTSASASSAPVMVISYSSSQPSSISGTDSHESIASSSLITGNTPTSSVSNSSPISTDTSTPAPVQNPTESSVPISGQNSATKLPTEVETAASVVFVTVVGTASPQSSTQVYDDGMWHTYYPVRNT